MSVGCGRWKISRYLRIILMSFINYQYLNMMMSQLSLLNVNMENRLFVLYRPFFHSPFGLCSTLIQGMYPSWHLAKPVYWWQNIYLLVLTETEIWIWSYKHAKLWLNHRMGINPEHMTVYNPHICDISKYRSKTWDKKPTRTQVIYLALEFISPHLFELWRQHDICEHKVYKE